MNPPKIKPQCTLLRNNSSASELPGDYVPELLGLGLQRMGNSCKILNATKGSVFSPFNGV